MNQYEFFAAPERTLSELAAFACSDNSIKAFNIHRDKMTKILELNGWDDRIIREALCEFKASRREEHNLRCPASALTARLNRIIKSLEKGVSL